MLSFRYVSPDRTGPERKRDQLLAAVDFDRPLILADLPATSPTRLEQFDRDAGFFTEVARNDYRPTLVNGLLPFSTSTRSVREMI